MRLYRRYSVEPLLELRLDHGSERTVQDRAYLHFHCSADGSPVTRMKSIQGTPEEADAFVQSLMPFFLAVSGSPWARHLIHWVLKAYGMHVRRPSSTKGR